MEALQIPETGRNHDEILKEMSVFAEVDADWRSGKTWSLVYSLGEEHTQFLKEAHGRFFSENALNPLAFKSLKRFESEVVRMAAAMFHGDKDVVGTMTSGGTESCLLAVKTYRDLTRAKRPWLRKPEVIAPESVHIAFEKGAHYFGVKLVRVPVDDSFRMDLNVLRKKTNRNTILIVGSAPCYPFGVVDPIEELGKIAQEKGLPLHVDSCLGGFMLPFVERLGNKIPPFDFRVPGVTSITADVHKYGYGAKGASVILYRNMEYLKHQFFVYTEWCGGIFISPALLGTRSGGPIAAAWAAMQALGIDGYTERARIVMEATARLTEGIAAIPGLKILGKPDMSVFAYVSDAPALSIYAVGDLLEKKGWHVDRLQKPEALHAMVTPGHLAVADAFLSDLREAVEEARAHPELADRGNAAMYGIMANLPLRGMVKKNVLKVMEQMYGPDGAMPDLDTAALDAEGGGTAPDISVKLATWLVKLKRRFAKK